MEKLDESTLIRMYWINQLLKLPTREECRSLEQPDLERVVHQMNVDFATISDGYIRVGKRSLSVKVGELAENLRFKAILYWSLYASITEEYFLKDESIWDLSDPDTLEWIQKFKLVFGDFQTSQVALPQVLMYAKSDDKTI